MESDLIVRPVTECRVAPLEDGPITVSPATLPAPPQPPRLPTDTPANASPEDAARGEAIRDSGRVLSDHSTAAYLQSVVGPSFGGLVGPTGYQAYRDQLLRDSGNPHDPIERMLMEEFLLGHQQLGRLHTRANQAQTPELVKAFYGATCRLQGEMRRLASAIKAYREPSRARSFTVVKQQNVAAGEQNIALVEKSERSNGKDSFGRRAKLGGKRSLNDDRTKTVNFSEESTACGGGEAESAKKPRLDDRGPPETARERASTRAVAVLDRAPDSGICRRTITHLASPRGERRRGSRFLHTKCHAA